LGIYRTAGAQIITRQFSERVAPASAQQRVDDTRLANMHTNAMARIALRR
jgi:hypothetical protein